MSSGNRTQIDAVLFDLYGTLVEIEIDTSKENTWNQFARELEERGLAIAPARLRSRYAHLVAQEQHEHGEPFVLDPCFFHKLLDYPSAQLSEPLVEFFGQRFRALTTRKLHLRPYVLPLFAELRNSGCKIGLVSNTEGIVTRHDLKTLCIDNLFDVLVLSSEIGTKKPDRQIFTAALGALQTTPDKAIFIGDDYAADFLGAGGAGLLPILLCPQKHGGVECTPPRLSAILTSLEQNGWRPARKGSADSVLRTRDLGGCA